MWIEISAGVIVVGLLMLMWRWLVSRMDKAESLRKKELYRENGQTNYVPREECSKKEESFCAKVDELKTLIVSMDKKREAAKDDYHKWQIEIGQRRSAIETKLKAI